jgi:hypothetical protein
MFMKYLPMLALAVIFGFAPSAAVAQGSVAGDWELTLNTPQGFNTVNLTLAQDGDKITGNLNSPMGSVPVTGTNTAGALALTAHIDIQGNGIDLGLNGKVEGESLNGAVKFGDFGEFPFTGKRAAPKTAASSGGPAPGGGAPAVNATDANGHWNIILTLAGAGEFPVSATLTQQGEKVSGTFSSAIGDVAVAGTMVGKLLKLEFTAETPQGSLPVTMTGELGTSGFIGKATIVGMGEADWTGTRVP